MQTAVATVASLLAARAFTLPQAYWASVTTIGITQSSLGAAFAVSSQRFVGAALGAAVGAIVANYLGYTLLLFAMSVFVLGLLCAQHTSTEVHIGLGVSRWRSCCCFRGKSLHGKLRSIALPKCRSELVWR
jgi:uncharacterized membrane protein YgaE (UPF0421/DUF939 family)